MTLPPKSLYSPLQSFYDELGEWYHTNWIYDLHDLSVELYLGVLNETRTT